MNFIKVKVIVNWATSTNLKEIQDFVDFINFYWCFIKNFSKLVKSFIQLTWKDTSFVWNEVCIEVFDNLKKQISSISVLHHFNCYDSSYASMLIAMLMTMLMTIVDRSSLDYRIVSRSTLFRVSLCSSESYR